ncbi:von Willebrand factor type A domain protein [Candidatus Magnetomorum sp. HK-1]|nr:von Willebrand factor type A domain protein [Candidatus Magnetomorum sp. HK-1]
MKFEYLWIMNLLWAVPALFFVYIIARRRREHSLKLFADSELLPRLTSLESRFRQGVRAVIVLIAVSFMILALAGPRWGEHFEEVSQKGVDIIICMDVSLSMMVEDIKPNRLERAKREIVDLINVTQGDRLGLVAFAGQAFLQCPLTLDYSALDMFLKQLAPDLIPVTGTDLGKAIELSIDSFDKESETDRVLVMITDGEDNEKKGLEAAEKARDEDIRIFVFGMGDPAGGPVPAGEAGGFEKDESGNLILSKLDEQSLVDIAQITGGDYVRSTDGDFDLDRLYFDGIRRKTDVSILKTGKVKVYEPRFYIFAALALALLLLESILHAKHVYNTV